LRSDDQAMIVAVGSEIETVAPLSSDRHAQQRAIAGLEPWGTTGLHDAIIASIDAIQSAKGRRAVVLLSDGPDRYRTASASGAPVEPTSPFARAMVTSRNDRAHRLDQHLRRRRAETCRRGGRREIARDCRRRAAQPAVPRWSRSGAVPLLDGLDRCASR